VETILRMERRSLWPDATPTWHPIETSFAGDPKQKASYALVTDGEFIQVSFRVAGKPFALNSPIPGTFYEGLWFADCGEFWLYSPESDRYLEFNVGPEGAWWGQAFSAPRVRDLTCDPPTVSTQVLPVPEGWGTQITFPWKDVERSLGTNANLLANVTLVLGGCGDPDTPENHFHSVAEFIGGKKDFHRPKDWLTLIVDGDIL
jgi:hypothetical protein